MVVSRLQLRACTMYSKWNFQIPSHKKIGNYRIVAGGLYTLRLKFEQSTHERQWKRKQQVSNIRAHLKFSTLYNFFWGVSDIHHHIYRQWPNQLGTHRLSLAKYLAWNCDHFSSDSRNRGRTYHGTSSHYFWAMHLVSQQTLSSISGITCFF